MTCTMKGEGLASGALFPRLNRHDVGRGKLWRISQVNRPESRTGNRLKVVESHVGEYGIHG
jgi:hypothetical protein